MSKGSGKMKSGGVISASGRLRQDYLRLKRDPVPYIVAEPLPSNLLEWHYVVTGPENSPYHGGFYHGKLVFPSEFPFKPPAIYMITPNGRFATQKRLCLSISDFHPDTWNPAWSVGTILTGLLSFMLEKSPTLGSIETSDHEKRQYARRSLEYNLRNSTFKELFPEITATIKEELNRRTELENFAQRRRLGSTVVTGGSWTAGTPGHPQNAAGNNNQDTFLNGAVTNFLVIGGFAVFAYLVKHVIQTSFVVDD